MTNQSTGSASRVPFARLSLSLEKSLRSLDELSRRSLGQVCGAVSFVAALMLTCAVGASAQAPTLQPEWNQLSPATSPSLRFATAMAYDSAHSQVVMFSGLNAPADTWLWNGTNWTQASPANSPSARSAQAMAYDSAHGQVVMFGGAVGSTRVNETWLWDGTNWTQASPLNSPSARNGTQMAYDAAHGNVVLFGGVDAGGNNVGDTWLWDGSNWTQASPSLSPAGRQQASMAYDAALGEVVLFGGLDLFGQEDNDTWAWNGTTWTTLSPAHLPSARYGAAIAYDAALSQLILFGGYNGTAYTNDTWEFNGTDWTLQSHSTSPSVRISENAVVYDAASSQIVLFGGFNGSDDFNDTWTWGTSQNFGNVNVCPLGQSTPAPCSITLPLTFSFAQPSTILSINVVTQGANGLDFTQANGGNCSGSIGGGSTCTMDVAFTPLAPGLRTGAVQLSVNSQGADQLATFPIYGVGQGAVAVFSPLTTFVENAGTLTGPKGVVVDAAGDLFVSDYEGHKVVEIGPSTGNQLVTIAQSPQISLPQGLAMDGAGNLYVGDTGIPGVVKIPWGCTNSTCQQTVPNPLGLSGQFGVSVDPQGDLFVSSYNQGEVVEVPVDGGAQTPVYNGTTPIGTAVDAAGDLFVADAGGGAVVKVPAGCTNSGCYVPIGSNWSTPQAVSLDAAGDLYVTDSNLRAIVEIPAGCVSSSCQITIASAAETSLGSGFQPWDAVPDGQGNIYIADHGLQRVDAILQQFAGLNFSASTVNNISGDSPQSVLFQNIGNQALTAAGQGLVFSDPDFTRVAGPGSPADCTSTFSLAPGAPCNLSVQFDPLSAGSLTGNAIFYDNALNNPASSQSIPFTGTGEASIPSYTLLVTDVGAGAGTVTDQFSAISCSVPTVSSTACSASYQSGTPITLTATPSAGASFLGWGGACAGASTTCSFNMNSSLNVTANFGQPSFGNINLCPQGGTGQPPCSSSQQVTFIAPTNLTGVSVQVVTQGTGGLDFTLGNSTCTGTLLANASCAITVNFAPQAPGLRLGAVVINGAASGVSGTIATIPISGIGHAPEIAFDSALPTSVDLGGSYSLSSPVAVDAAGNIYLTASGQLLKKTSGGVQTLLSSGLSGGTDSLAVDGAGNVFVADNEQGRVFKVPANGGTATSVYPSQGFGVPRGIALDSEGNLFVADSQNQDVVEVPANGGAQIVVFGPSSSAIVQSVAVDGAGDVFVALNSPGSIVEIPAGCTNSNCQITVGTGWNTPSSLAVDAAGDLFVADPGLASGNGQIIEVPFGCINANCQVLLADGNTQNFGVNSYGLAVDGQGNVFYVNIDSNTQGQGTGFGQLYEIPRSQGSVSLGVVSENFRSSDSPLLVQNIGNQLLTGSVGSVSGTVFAEDAPNSTCGTFSLAPGASCVENFNAFAQTVGPISGTALAIDNSLNVTSATQQISLSALSIGPAVPVTVSGLGAGSGFVQSDPGTINCNLLAGVASGTCSINYSAGLQISFEEVPTNGSTFVGWGGACAGQGINQFCTVTITAATNVSANFSSSATTYPLSVTLVGSGGTVTSNVGGISCSVTNGADSGICASNYAPGSLVTLTANPTGNAIFAGWGGDCASSGASLTCNVTVNSALNATASFVAPGATQAGSLMPITAGVVYGQGGSFTSVAPNNGGVANGFSLLSNVTVDASGNLYVADGGNNRVLFYPQGSTTPTRVYGQNGSFTSNSPNIGGAVSANGLSNPLGVVVDSTGDLYVADQNNNRVLFYPAGQTTPTRVYGQPGFNTGDQNTNGLSASSLFDPWGLAVDASGGLYVADYVNSRVLFYPAGSTTATRVYGQNGSFTSNSVNLGGVSADSLSQPTGVALDASGDLYVADIFNNRVLFYPNNSTTATRVYGQNGSFTSNSANNGGVSANSLNNPMGLTLDSTGDLYVIDRSNNRLLLYPFGSTTATMVYGQAGSFTNATPNSGGISANSLSQPLSVALDSSGNVYVTDFANNRVLEYGTFGNVNVCPAGQNTPAPCNTTVTLSYASSSATTLGATQVVTQGTSGLDFTLSSGGSCTGAIAAGSSCTVNVKFAPLAPGLRMGAVTLFDNTGSPVATSPLYGIGQAPLAVFGPGKQSTLPVSGLAGVSGVAVDAAGNVFISQNTGAVKITPAGIQTTVPTTGISLAYDVAVDGAGNVFLADLGGNKVVKVTPGGVQTTVPATGLSSPSGVAVDGAGNVFITDTNNNRVVKVTPSGVQTTVPASGVNSPYYPAVDAAGDVFFLNAGTGQVLKVTPGGIQSTIPISGLAAGNGVAVDAAGDVFVSDQINNVVLEVSPSGLESTVPTTGLSVPAGLAVDALGNVFIAVNGLTRVVEVNRSQVPSLSFPLTNAGSSSGVQAVSLQNVGNQPLIGTLSASGIGPNFVLNGNSTCNSSFSLAAGEQCLQSFNFTPQSASFFTGAAVFTDNTLNSSPVTQTINLSGTGSTGGQVGTVAVPNVVGQTQAAATTPITGAGLVLGTVTTASSDTVPSGSVISQSPTAGTQVTVGSAVNLFVSTGQQQPPSPNPLSVENNYFVTGDYASAGVTLRGTGHKRHCHRNHNHPQWEPGCS